MYYIELFEELYKNQIKYLILGGLAVNLYGVPRATQDIDIAVSFEQENIIKLITLLKKLGYVPRLPVDPQELTDANKVKDWIKNKNLKAFNFYHQHDNYKVIDIILAFPLDFEESFKHKTVKRVKDIEIYLASIDDVIKTKELSGRAQDLNDIEMLKKAKKYLKQKK